MLYEPDERRSRRGTLATLAWDPALRQHLADAERDQMDGRSWRVVIVELVERVYQELLVRTATSLAA